MADPTAPTPTTTTLTIRLDHDDSAIVHEAMTRRANWCVPDGQSCREGTLIAEICRGYLEMLAAGVGRRQPKKAGGTLPAPRHSDD